MEHTPLSPRDLYPLVLAAERRQLKIVVRIPQKDEAYFKWCRDLNVSSIQVPHVATKEDALNAIKFSCFYPIGERGLCRFVRAADFSSKDKNDYLNEANSNNQLIFQIEGKNAIQNIPEIVGVMNPSTSLFLGPYDLSQSLGKPGQIWDNAVVEEMLSVIHICKQKRIRVGSFTDSLEGVKFWKDKGLDFIQFASDLNLFLKSAQELRSSV
jgi:4-hydroxy-2-oxoheptanedioate aldolase